MGDKKNEIGTVPYKTYWSYPVKFICGQQVKTEKEVTTFRPGCYATDINILNYQGTPITVYKNMFILIDNGKILGRENSKVRCLYQDQIVLNKEATFDDCYHLAEIAGQQNPTLGPISMGFLEIISPIEIHITVVYTVTDDQNLSTDIEVVTIQGKQVKPIITNTNPTTEK
jgi:hypothetical protein